MKKISFIILSAFTLVSCFKSDHRDLGVDYSGEGYLKYELNGLPFEYTGGYKRLTSGGIGVFARKLPKSATVPVARYTIMGQIGVNKLINIVIITDSLKTGSYTTSTFSNAVTSVKIDSIQYSNNRSADFLTVTISKYSAGIIEGTVSGKLSASKTANGSTTYTDGVITNGVFQNVIMQYQ
ncbi:MAG: hypothetical protein JWQ09_4290 [Segetibacter sp.]|nr:hypothetical protein [Segetibacter sp.]